MDEVHYRGWTIRLADWLHLSNPDDPSRPIVGHVFKCWISDEACVSFALSREVFFPPPSLLLIHTRVALKLTVHKWDRARKGQPGLSICWYYRPEQVNPNPFAFSFVFLFVLLFFSYSP